MMFVGDYLYVGIWEPSNTGGRIEEYELSGSHSRTVGVYPGPGGIAGLERASEFSVWAVGPFPRDSVAQIALSDGHIIRVIYAPIGSVDIEIGPRLGSPIGDLDGDRDVDLADLSALLTNFGRFCD